MSDETRAAAIELLHFIARRYYIQDVEEFYCPKMKALAKTIPAEEWAIKKSQYDDMRQKSINYDMALPECFFFEVVMDKFREDETLAIYLCAKWEYDTDCAFVNEIVNDWSYFRLKFPGIVDFDETFHNDYGVIRANQDCKLTIKDIADAMKKEGFEEKAGLAELYKKVYPEIKEMPRR